MPHAGAGLLISAAQVWALIDMGTLPELTLPVLLPLLAFLPLVGASAGMARRVIVGDTAPGRAALREAHDLLQGLSTVAREIPGGLEPTTITAAALEELQAEPAVTAVAIYAGHGPLLRRMAAAGFSTDPPIVLPADSLLGLRLRLARRVLPVRALPDSLIPFCGALPTWLLVPLVEHGKVTCCVLVGAGDARRLRSRLQSLVALAEDIGLALENARLFGDAQTRAAEAARRRIAHDLHDGAAQSLTHLRMELDLLARIADEATISLELAKLSRVTGRDLQDVRATIDGLRGQVVGGGIAGALEQHARDLDGTGGVRVVVDGIREVSIEGDRAMQLFRVAQEALSNAGLPGDGPAREACQSQSVWQTGPAGQRISRNNLEWRKEFQDTLADLREDDIAGSGFAVTGYTVHESLGGDGALARLRERLHSRGLRLLLDFVPNHTGLDHPWVENHPDYYIAGTELDLARAPQNYTWARRKGGDLLLA